MSSLELNSPLLRDTLGLGIFQESFGPEPGGQGEAAVREGAGLCHTSVTSTVGDQAPSCPASWVIGRGPGRGFSLCLAV